MLRVTVHDDGGNLAAEARRQAGGRWAARGGAGLGGARRTAKPAKWTSGSDLRRSGGPARCSPRMHAAARRWSREGVAMSALVSEMPRRPTGSAGDRARLRRAARADRAARCRRGRRIAQSPAAPLRLTLQQAVTLGLKQAPEVAIANLESRREPAGAALPRAAHCCRRCRSACQREGDAREASRRCSAGASPGFPEHSGPFWSFRPVPRVGAGVRPRAVEPAGAPRARASTRQRRSRRRRAS